MKYFYCEDCDEIFSEESAGTKSVYDGYGELDYYACPTCGSTELADADTCEVCGRPIPPDKHICDECQQEMKGAWTALVEKVMDLRLKANYGKSADYIDCEDGVLEYLREARVVL